MRAIRLFPLLLACLAPALPAAAQQAPLPTIGYLWGSSAGEQEKLMDDVLAERGYVDGRTVTVIRRFADGDFARLPVLAAELVEQRVQIIVAQTTAAAQAAKAVTADIPIVVTSSGDAVGSGLAASLARPGGNVTGVSFLGTELAVKQLELIRELVPSVRRIGFVANRGMAPETVFFAAMQGPARERGLQIDFVDVQSVEDFGQAFDELKRLRADAAIVAPGGFFSDHRGALLAAAKRHAIPALYFRRGFVADGGLASYGSTLAELYRLAADQVDRILKGADPAFLPILQPTRFELVINLRTARDLRLEIPATLLARADEVIE
jgi:putative ABC transport system substrate-binding protein